jgi:hypothetical protein
MTKRQAPRKQLIEAGKQAREILADRGIIRPDTDSAVARILQSPDAPILPGGGGSPWSPQPYVPQPITIRDTRRIVRDLGRMWQADIEDDDPRKLIGIEFFKYVIEELNKTKSKLNVAIVKTIEDKTYDQKFLSRQEVIDAITKFLCDSFAVAIVVHSHTDVVDYLEWFDEWSMKLAYLWPLKDRWLVTGEKSPDIHGTQDNS